MKVMKSTISFVLGKKNIFFCTIIIATHVSADFTKLLEKCVEELSLFPGYAQSNLLQQACQKVTVFDECISVEGRPIFHYEKISNERTAKKILVFSLIHGDETGAGVVGRYWMQRLEEISPRNSWRVVPILNPDGLKYKTRTNANKIDLNRNFPTKDWDQLAHINWQKSTQSNPRRFPGSNAGSEPEVRCALKQIDTFKPDFVVSIHTPLNVLDYDGPKVNPPSYDYLPWKSLGHFPGSLGRYLWFERRTPVLTTELKPSLPKNERPFEKLQDVIGTLMQMEQKNKTTLK